MSGGKGELAARGAEASRKSGAAPGFDFEEMREWVAIWCTIYASFLVSGLLFPDGNIITTIIRYLGIFLNLVYVHRNFRKDALLTIAILFTFLADTILMLDNSAFIGVFIFAVTQCFHFLRITGLRSKHFITFLVLVTVMLYLAKLTGLDFMLVMGGIYASLLVLNIIFSLRWYFKERTGNALAASIGFILFTLCDTCVMLSYFSRTGGLPMAILPVVNYLAWVFYYPSQIFIINSSKTRKVVVQ